MKNDQKVEIIAFLFRIHTHTRLLIESIQLQPYLTPFVMLSVRKDSFKPASRLICSCLTAALFHLTDALMLKGPCFNSSRQHWEFLKIKFKNLEILTSVMNRICAISVKVVVVGVA